MSSPGAGRILVVDGDTDGREMLAAFLRFEGYDVGEAASAEEARRALAGSPWDVLVTEHELDGEAGAAMLVSLRAAGKLPKGGAIMCTAHPDAPRVDGVPCLHKPIELERLLHEIERRVQAAAPGLPPPRDEAHGEPNAAVELVLYVTDSLLSLRAKRNVQAVLASLHGRARLQIRNLAVDPSAGAEDRVAFTPMLVRRGPGPRATLVGDMRDSDAVRELLVPHRSS